jgi:hypothetical protein
VPQTLVKALQEAGAVDAMQLDINPYWSSLYSLQSIRKWQIFLLSASQRYV